VTSRDRVLVWIAPALLVALAATQLFLATTRDLTPWKGGGFGMFASTDRLGYRAMQAVIVTDAGEFALDVHELRDHDGPARAAFSNARALMDDTRGRRLAEIVARGEWRIEDDVARLDGWLAEGEPGPLVRDADGEVLTVHRGWFEVWRTTYDRDTRRLIPRPAGSYGFEVAP
jgi:hypothetical protein